MQYPHSFYRNQVVALHSRWIEALRSIKEVSEPSVKALWIEDLIEISKQAMELRVSGELHPHDSALLAHITDRSIHEHIALLKGGRVVSVY
jgi:hypothetical protein